MGVRLLLSYLRSTIARVSALKATFPSETIVIDLLSGSRRYFEGDHLWNFAKMRHGVAQDVKHLRKAGFRVMAFTDPGYENRQEFFWINRRLRDLKSTKELNSMLRSSTSEIQKLVDARWRPPLTVGTYLAEAFAENRVPIYISHQSADREGAGLVLKYDAYGILTADTDFLLFPGVKRFFFFPSMQIEKDGTVWVEGVNRSLFLRYLGLSEEKAPMIAGFMGNDFLSGLPPNDKKYITFKWRLDYLPEAAAMEISTAEESTLPSGAHEAVKYYKALTPNEWSPDNVQFEDPTWIGLKEQKAIFCRGVAFDSLEKRSCHDVLEPLRHAVYARNELGEVKEFLCRPNQEPTTWSEGSVIQLSENDVKAPLPPEQLLECVKIVCDFLKASGELDDGHHQAIIAQVIFREEIEAKVESYPMSPRMDDLHVASLFLQAMDIFCLGASNSRPKCWEYFHGPMFHYLCQRPDELIALAAVDTTSVYDWTPIICASIPGGGNSSEKMKLTT